MKRILSMALGIAALGSAALAADTMLKVGDPAPPLKVAKWVKGQPTEKFATGEVYVVEFWATWCGPCRMTIPHLTEMNKQFAGKAHFMGVSIWERVADDTQRLEKVGKFVDTMGAKMEYAVAADATGDFMANNWMVPARQGGIPTAFVVDRNSKIAWIGHPMSDMDKVVSQVIAGTFDVKAEAERRAKAPVAPAKPADPFQSVNNLRQQGKYKEALVELDKIVAAHVEHAKTSGLLRFYLLLEVDEPAAYITARELAEGDLKDDAGSLYRIVRTITDPNPRLKGPDYDAALAVATRACELTKFEDPFQLGVLAEAHFGMGNVVKAIEIQQLAINQLTQQPNAPEGNVIYLSDRLEAFKKAQQSK